MNFLSLICFSKEPTDWFDQALSEAQKGLGLTHPNPAVGCVIVKDQKLIAAAHHVRAGEPHAEVNALYQAGPEARGATLYVTLEPCNHFGRTPPCTQAIIKAGIQKVIYGVSDPDPRVIGQGAQVLGQAGIQVALVNHPDQIAKAQALIRPFRKLAIQKQPYVLAKIACSLDGKIAFRPGQQTQITGPESRQLVHRMREACDAIVIGSETVLVDDPQLTARFKERKALRQPIRIVLDGRLRTHPKHKVYAADGVQSYVIYGSGVEKSRIKAFEKAGVIGVALEKSPLKLLQYLGTLGLSCVLLEGGGQLLTSFLEQNLIDELAWFTAPVILGNQGVPAISNLSAMRYLSSCQMPEILSKDRLWLISSAC